MNLTGLSDNLVSAVERAAAEHQLTKDEKDFTFTILARLNGIAMEYRERINGMARLCMPWEDGEAIGREIMAREFRENVNEMKMRIFKGLSDQPRRDLIIQVLTQVIVFITLFDAFGGSIGNLIDES